MEKDKYPNYFDKAPIANDMWNNHMIKIFNDPKDYPPEIMNVARVIIEDGFASGAVVGGVASKLIGVDVSGVRLPPVELKTPVSKYTLVVDRLINEIDSSVYNGRMLHKAQWVLYADESSPRVKYYLAVRDAVTELVWRS